MVEAAARVAARPRQPPAPIRLPVPANLQVVQDDAANLGRPYAQSGVIHAAGANLSPTHDREVYYHEVGHVVDSMMPDAMRKVIARDIFGQDASQWSGNGDYVRNENDPNTPMAEFFADAYSGLALNQPGHWDDAYKGGYVGKYPTPKPIPLAKMEQLRQMLATLTKDPRFRGLNAIQRSLKK